MLKTSRVGWAVILILASLNLIDCSGQIYSVKKSVKSISIYAVQILENEAKDTLAYSTQDSSQIRRIVSFMTDKGSPFYKCGYSGKMKLLLGQGEVFEIEFNSNPECGHYVYEINGKRYSRRLSRDGIAYFDSLFNSNLKDVKLW